MRPYLTAAILLASPVLAMAAGVRDFRWADVEFKLPHENGKQWLLYGKDNFYILDKSVSPTTPQVAYIPDVPVSKDTLPDQAKRMIRLKTVFGRTTARSLFTGWIPCLTE